MVRGVIQDGAGPGRERLVFKDQNDFYSCAAAAEKGWLLRCNHDKKAKGAETDA